MDELSDKFTKASINSTTAENHHTPKPIVALDDFALFSKLPLEIRRMIWREAVPRRYVKIDLDWHPDIAPPLVSINTLIMRTKIAPITLSINQESRSETQLFYHIIYPKVALDPRYNNEGDSPLVINPDKDVVSFSTIGISPYMEDFHKWLTYLDQNLPGGTASIKHLETRDCTIPTSTSKSTSSVSAQTIKEGRNIFDRLLLRFPGLEKLTLSFADGHCPCCVAGHPTPSFSGWLSKLPWNSKVPESEVSIDWECCGKTVGKRAVAPCELRSCHICSSIPTN